MNSGFKEELTTEKCSNHKWFVFQTENGEIDLEITNAELISLISNCGSVCNENDLERKTFQVKVEYTEDFTNLNGSVTEKFEVRKNALNIRFAPFSPTYYRVGIPFNGFVSFVFDNIIVD